MREESGNPPAIAAKRAEPPPGPVLSKTELKQGGEARLMTQIVEIIEDKRKYAKLVKLLAEKRILKGAGYREFAARNGLEEERLAQIESGKTNASCVEIIDYILGLNEDVAGIIKEVR